MTNFKNRTKQVWVYNEEFVFVVLKTYDEGQYFHPVLNLMTGLLDGIYEWNDEPEWEFNHLFERLA